MRMLWILFFAALLLVGVRARAGCAGPVFDDRALASELGGAADLLVYVWSPLMPLSVIGRGEVLELARDGFAVRVVMDPARRLCGLMTEEPRLGSAFLLANSALNHFPTLFYFREGALALTLHGYESPERLRARLFALRDAGFSASKGQLP